jgi:hypothetical protein
MNIRDRIKELRRVRAGDLRPHPKNWRNMYSRNRQCAVRAIDGKLTSPSTCSIAGV